MTALLIGKGMATLKELQTYYSYEDALDMSEVILVNNYNEDLVYRKLSDKK